MIHKTAKRKHEDYRNDLLELLVDPSESVGYLNAVLDEGDLSVFLIALKDVLEAQIGSMSVVAKKTGLNRENLYRMMSEQGNPEFSSIRTLLSSAGLKLTIAAQSQKKAKSTVIPKSKKKIVSRIKKNTIPSRVRVPSETVSHVEKRAKAKK